MHLPPIHKDAISPITPQKSPVAGHYHAPHFGFTPENAAPKTDANAPRKAKSKGGRPPSPKFLADRALVEGVVTELYTRLVAIGKFIPQSFPLYPWRIVKKKLPKLPKHDVARQIKNVGRLGEELGFQVFYTLDDPLFVATCKARSSTRLKELRTDPDFNKAQQRALGDPKVQAKKSTRMKEQWGDPDFAEANRERSRQLMRRLNKDPEFAEANRERSRERMTKLHQDPDFVAALRERARQTMKKQRQDPNFNQKMLAGIRRYLAEQEAIKVANPNTARGHVNHQTGMIIDIKDSLAVDPADIVIGNEEAGEQANLGKRLAQAMKILDPIVQALLCDEFGIQAPPGRKPRKGAKAKRPEGLPEVNLDPKDRKTLIEEALKTLRQKLT